MFFFISFCTVFVYFRLVKHNSPECGKWVFYAPSWLWDISNSALWAVNGERSSDVLIWLIHADNGGGIIPFGGKKKHALVLRHLEDAFVYSLMSFCQFRVSISLCLRHLGLDPSIRFSPNPLRGCALLMLWNTKHKMFSIKMKMNCRVQPPVEPQHVNYCQQTDY